MVNIMNKNQCVNNNCIGCGACYNICPASAILINLSEEGFYTAEIEKDKCRHCGLCESVCPLINELENNNFKNPKCYAVTTDDNIRLKSSSGGIFSVLAEKIIDNNGFVVGAAFNENWGVEHIIIDNKEDLQKLRKSKYLQSNIGSVLQDVKKLLSENKTVLFSGVPCQVAGLKSFLNKDYCNLITIDLICGGTLPPGLWYKFLKENYPSEKILNIDFRNKDLGWNCVTTTTTTTTGTYYSNDWMDLHIKFLAQHKICPQCKFKTLPRQGDMTIGDFWGLQNYRPELVDNKGISLILTNNLKGESYFTKIKNNLNIVENIPLEFAKSCPQALVKKASENSNRERFFNLTKRFSVKKSAHCALYDKYDVGIMGLWFYENYGAILTQVALHRLIEDFGLIPVLIDNSGLRKEPLSSDWAKDFCRKWCNTTQIFYTADDLTYLNDKIDIFVSGSDQLWNRQPFENSYFLDFVFNNKKKISCATSFGRNYINYNKEELPLISYYLKKYDLVTVRESSGVDICKNDLGINAKQILDPVFLVDRNFYFDIIKTSKLTLQEPFAVAYILRNSGKKDSYINNLAQSKNIKIIKIEDAGDEIRAGRNPASVEDFLWYMSNAEYIITDSFHATTFALIFNKKFVSFNDNSAFDDRFRTINKLFDIGGRCQDTNKTEYTISIDLPIDYNKINLIIEKEKQKNIALLKETLFSRTQKFLTDLDVAKVNAINIKKCLEKSQYLNKYKFKYQKYRFLSNFVFGSKKQYYKDKKYKMKELIENCLECKIL